MNKPSVSIVTVFFNTEATIRDTVRSVMNQTHPVEYIVVDGASQDGTVDVVRELLSQSTLNYQIISERDRGMYDAMRKGIAASHGDVVAILNADDRFESNESVEKVASAFAPDIDVVIGDVIITDQDFGKVLRYYSASAFRPEDLTRGIMPPHAGFYARRHLFEKLGSYTPDYRYAGDFELILQFLLKARVKLRYLPEILVRMRTGGLSNRSLRHRFNLTKEVLRALKENGYPSSWLLVLSKIPGKLFQYFRRPPGQAR